MEFIKCPYCKKELNKIPLKKQSVNSVINIFL